MFKKIKLFIFGLIIGTILVCLFFKKRSKIYNYKNLNKIYKNILLPI